MMVARSQETLNEHAAELGGPAHAVPLVCDLSGPDAAARCVERVLEELGDAPDVLVNNAAAFAVASIEDTSPQDFERMLTLNVSVPFAVVRGLLPRMRARLRGHVVTIGSVADRNAFPNNSAYAASKFALRAMTDVLRKETQGSGIRVSLISPGPVDTPIWDAIDPDSRPGFTPRRQMLTPQDVAAAVWFVASQPPTVNVSELRLAHT